MGDGVTSGPGPDPGRHRPSRRLRKRQLGQGAGDDAPRIRCGHRVFFHEQREPFFGPGAYRLLVLVDEVGSLHQAAKSLGMSYSKAWRLVRHAEEHLGFELLDRRTGGAAGGGSVLTEDGRELARRFGALVAEADAELERLCRKHFGDMLFGGRGTLPGDGPGQVR